MSFTSISEDTVTALLDNFTKRRLQPALPSLLSFVVIGRSQIHGVILFMHKWSWYQTNNWIQYWSVDIEICRDILLILKSILFFFRLYFSKTKKWWLWSVNIYAELNVWINCNILAPEDFKFKFTVQSDWPAQKCQTKQNINQPSLKYCCQDNVCSGR